MTDDNLGAVARWIRGLELVHERRLGFVPQPMYPDNPLRSPLHNLRS